jgi:hypothetical protein
MGLKGSRRPHRKWRMTTEPEGFEKKPLTCRWQCLRLDDKVRRFHCRV